MEEARNVWIPIKFILILFESHGSDLYIRFVVCPKIY